MNLSDLENSAPQYKRLVVGILVISLLLRWVLVMRGGQFYFSDEHRYQVSQEFVDFATQGKLAQGFSRLFIAPEHLGFKILGIFPALIEKLTHQPSLVIPALFFSLFSVFNLYLIFLLSQRAGASPLESLLALGIAAASQSLLYYSRHLMPYDPAMTFGLLSLFVGIKKTASIRDSFLCGVLGFLCFITYNGYWLMAGFAMLAHLFSETRQLSRLVHKGIGIAIGFAIPLLLILLAASLSGVNLMMEYSQFAGTVTQGDYAEGWSLPFEYFWHTEHFLIVALGLLSLYAIFNMLKTQEKNPGRWLGGILFIYIGLVLFSVFFHSFVVLGRLARQIMPFLILLAAHGLAQVHVRKTTPQYGVSLIMVFMWIQGLWNYGTAFMLSYPREFTATAQSHYPDFSFSEKRLAFGAPALCENNGYIMENAKYLLDAPELPSHIQGELLLSDAHPVSFVPYQFEGYTPEQRREFHQRNLRMNFYKIENVSANDDILKNIKNCFIRE